MIVIGKHEEPWIVGGYGCPKVVRKPSRKESDNEKIRS